MRKELDDKLCQDFPNLYCDRHGDPRQTIMCFGFACSDGWYGIIHELSEKLEKLIVASATSDLCSNSNCEKKGHKKHAEECGVDRCTCRRAPLPARAVQVKEKFGGLRFYMDYETDEMRRLCSEAEKKSYEVCEKCGQPGVLRSDRPWILTLCYEHANEK